MLPAHYSTSNPAPEKDGIHDPKNERAYTLQSPWEAFQTLIKSRSGNRVDWSKSLQAGKIAPRYDLHNPDKQPIIMDLNIVREVKGSMPNVVYPHKEHTECHRCYSDKKAAKATTKD